MNKHLQSLAGLKGAFKQFTKETLFYSFSNLITKFTALLIVPIYTRILAPPEYGTIMALYSFFSVVLLATSLGLESGANKDYWDIKTGSKNSHIISTWLTTHTLAVILTCIPLSIFAEPVTKLIFNNNVSPLVFRVGLIALPLQALAGSFTRVLRTQRRASTAVVFTLTLSLVTATCTYSGIVILKLGIIGFVAGTALANFLVAVWIVYDSRHILRPPFIDPNCLRSLLATGAPMLPSMLWGWAISQSAILFITNFHTPSSASTYYLSNSIAIGAGLFMAVFQQAWVPFTFSISNQSYRHPFMNTTLHLYITAGSTISWLISTLSPHLFHIIAPNSYSHSAITTTLLSFGYITAGSLSIFSTEACIQNRASRVALGSLGGGVIAIMGHLILTKRYGPAGAALTILIANSTNVLILYLITSKGNNSRIKILSSLIPFMGALTAGSISNIFNQSTIFTVSTHIFAICALYWGWLKGYRALRARPAIAFDTDQD